MTDHLIIGTRRDDDRYVGVIRQGKTVVFDCGHRHHNRDLSTGTNGQSARNCVEMLIRAARFPGVADDVRRRILSGPGAYARSWSASSGMMERMQAAAQAQVDDIVASTAKVAEVIGTQAVYGYVDRIAFPAVA